MGKILLFAAIGITLVSAALGFLNHQTLADKVTKLEETSGKLTSTESTLKTKEGELKKKSEELAAATAEKEQLATANTSSKADLTAATSKVTALTADVETAKKDLETAKADLDTAQKKITELQSATPTTTAAAANPEADPKFIEQKALNDALQASLANKDNQLKALIKEKDDRAKHVQSKGLEGRILAVNPSWNFVVLNLGDRNGVINNAEMLVKRGGQLVGKVRITSVEPSSSIADIVSNSVPRGITIQPGDNVITSSEE